MTKVTILGEANTEQKKLKPIELCKFLDSTIFVDLEIGEQKTNWDNFILITKNYHSTNFDLMYAYDEGHINSDIKNCLYLGHFNDGVVEQ